MVSQQKMEKQMITNYKNTNKWIYLKMYTINLKKILNIVSSLV